MVVDDLLGTGVSAVVAFVRRLGGDFDPENVRALGTRLRGAFEGATLESPTFQRFPTEACTNACRLLSQYLFDQGVGDWGLVSARRKRPDGHDESHAWLAQGEWLLDITADQFDSELPQVILELATESAYNAEAENAVKTVKAGNLASAQELERERRAELKEQRALEAEIKREKERLEKERTHYLNSIQRLRDGGDEDAARALQSELDRIDAEIAEADYRAANIRAGYVYVISNVGAFGEGVVKIGMTRRLDPMDRVRELGDASVPFIFDVHALFFSDDAVEVEAMLHREFAAHRLNKVNLRTEFFRVEPQAVLDALHQHNVAVLEFKTHAAAEDFRASWPS